MEMRRELIHLPASTRPILTVVIHTEEEFDWGKPYDRRATGVEHMRHIERAQAIFDKCGIVPNYVVDYPIASQDTAIRPLKAFADSGRALIGAHLHPWVSPPYEEEVNVRNSYPCNLSRALEADKLGRLTEKIMESFGTAPRTYLAGRYGFGLSTAAILEELDYQVDISPAVPIDFSADGGPDYSTYSSHPYWFGEKRKLLGLPGTGGYVGWLRAGDTALYKAVTTPVMRRLRVGGICARLRAVERIRLSPEDYSGPEMQRLTCTLLRDGVRVFVFSFHSPSVMPGGTPYVRSQGELERFLDKCTSYFDFFMKRLDGIAMTPVEVRDMLNNDHLPKSTNPKSQSRELDRQTGRVR
jgi:hypothetical protein